MTEVSTDLSWRENHRLHLKGSGGLRRRGQFWTGPGIGKAAKSWTKAKRNLRRAPRKVMIMQIVFCSLTATVNEYKWCIQKPYNVQTCKYVRTMWGTQHRSLIPWCMVWIVFFKLSYLWPLMTAPIKHHIFSYLHVQIPFYEDSLYCRAIIKVINIRYVLFCWILNPACSIFSTSFPTVSVFFFLIVFSSVFLPYSRVSFPFSVSIHWLDGGLFDWAVLTGSSVT